MVSLLSNETWPSGVVKQASLRFSSSLLWSTKIDCPTNGIVLCSRTSLLIPASSGVKSGPISEPSARNPFPDAATQALDIQHASIHAFFGSDQSLIKINRIVNWNMQFPLKLTSERNSKSNGNVAANIGYQLHLWVVRAG